jgi:hypothetical protein
MKARKLKALFAGILIIGALLVGAVIYAIHRQPGINTLRHRIFLAKNLPETAKHALAKTSPTSDRLFGSNFSVDKSPNGSSANTQPSAKKNLEPEKDSSEEALYFMIAASIRRDFPDLQLTEPEIEELSQIIMQLRETIQGFRDFDQAEADLRELEEQRDDAMWQFERITGMSFIEFLNLAPAEGGVDNAESDRKKSILESYLDGDRS